MTTSNFRRLAAVTALAWWASAAHALPLSAVGPVSTNPGANPLPTWYADSGGLQVEPCLDVTRCGLAAAAGLNGGVFDSTLPIVFPPDATVPGNFPATLDYFSASATVNDATGAPLLTFLARLTVNFSPRVGGAPVNPTSTRPNVFTEISATQLAPLKPLTTYTIVHPWGADSFTTNDAGLKKPGAVSPLFCDFNGRQLNCKTKLLQDAPGALIQVASDFTSVLTSTIAPSNQPSPPNAPNDPFSIGTFLVSAGAPAGFLGDGVTAGPVTGSPTGNNLVSLVESPPLPAGSPQTTPPPSGAVPGGVVLGSSSDFVVVGQLFSGVVGPATHYAVSGLLPGQPVGTAQVARLVALDLNANAVTSYTGTAHFTSNDPAAVLPADVTFVAGVANATGIVPKTAGSFKLTATDVANPTMTGSQTIGVNTGAVASFSIVSGDGQSGPAGKPLAAPFVVKATDAAGNPISIPVTFTGPDGTSFAPISPVFTDASGIAVTTATLDTVPGTQVFIASAGGAAPVPPLTFTVQALGPPTLTTSSSAPSAAAQTSPKSSGGCGSAGGIGAWALSGLVAAWLRARRRR